jgi:hypothetical protein
LHALYTPDTQNPVELQALQTPPFAPWYPQSHTQSVSCAFPVPQCEFAGHARQSAAAAFPCAGWYVFAPQSWHAPTAVAPLEFRYVPAGHSAHSVAPPADWYDPALHALHVAAVADEV